MFVGFINIVFVSFFLTLFFVCSVLLIAWLFVGCAPTFGRHMKNARFILNDEPAP